MRVIYWTKYVRILFALSYVTKRMFKTEKLCHCCFQRSGSFLSALRIVTCGNIVYCNSLISGLVITVHCQNQFWQIWRVDNRKWLLCRFVPKHGPLCDSSWFLVFTKRCMGSGLSVEKGTMVGLTGTTGCENSILEPYCVLSNLYSSEHFLSSVLT